MNLDVNKFCDRTRNSPRLNSLLEEFEQISTGSIQAPHSLPEIDKNFLEQQSDYSRHEKIFRKNLCTFFRHGIASMPYLAEEIMRVDKALFEFAKLKNATNEHPLTYWETSFADGSRGRTLAEYTGGRFVTLTDSPNLGNKIEFENSPFHPFSFFHYGAFIDICLKFLSYQKIHPAFRHGFDIIWENTTFQMYDNNREEQIEYVSQSLKPEGLLILFEKMHSEDIDVYNNMERIKDKFKERYFDPEQIQKKKANILNTMQNGQVTKKQLIEAASKFFKYGALIWNSTNFYEIVVSNSKKNIESFLNFLPKAYVPKECMLEAQMVCCLWGDIDIPKKDYRKNSIPRMLGR